MCVHQNRDKGEKIENDKKKKTISVCSNFSSVPVVEFCYPFGKTFPL
jgi:hypothetical protein